MNDEIESIIPPIVPEKFIYREKQTGKEMKSVPIRFLEFDNADSYEEEQKKNLMVFNPKKIDKVK